MGIILTWSNFRRYKSFFMSSRFELFAKFSEGLFKYALDAFVGSGNKNRSGNMIMILAIILSLFIFIALLYAGVETVKLLFRDNFGKKGVNIVRVIISALAFLALSYVSYSMYSDFYYEYEVYGSHKSFLFASITFLVVGLAVLIKGILVSVRDNPVYDPIYRGDSNILGFLIKDGWSQSMVQDLAEPLFFLSFGFCLFSFNYVWGLPFIFCAISAWIHLGIESAFGFFDERKNLTNKGYAYTHNREFSKVVN